MGQAKRRGTYEERKAEALAAKASQEPRKPISPYGVRRYKGSLGTAVLAAAVATNHKPI